MSATVLGKRTRSTVAAASTNLSAEETGRRVATAVSCTGNASTATRSKRRIAVNEPNDENENPFITKKSAEDEVEDKDDIETRPTKKTRSSARTAPARHGGLESCVELSPAKVGSHFKVSKAEIGVYQDGKSEQENVEPQTPRRRDQLSKKVPVTPRHRVLIAGSQATPRLPKSPHTQSVANSVYNQARQLFSRCLHPGRLVGRENEKAEISSFIKTAVESNTTGCLYVSGPPGTGKSALLDEVIHEHTKDSQIPVSVVNCMSVRNTKDLSQKLSEDLDIKENVGFDHLRSCFMRGKARDNKKYLVVLDEVDQLVDLDLELLYSLFEWSMHNTSRLILVGIANALDLTDRFLPRLKSRNLKPELLPFMPYSAAQIANVVTSKLKTLSSEDSQNVPFLHPAAIQFCAKKVAAQTGDLRKAFDICKRAIDLVERETREKDVKAALENSPSKTPLMENINLSSPAKSPAKEQTTYTVETAPKATIAHMARVTALAFGNGATQRLGGLNLQQKAVLCALAALEKRKRETQLERTMFATPSKTSNGSAPSVKQLFEAYSVLCRQEKLFHALSSLEFRDVVSGLETLSLVSGVDGKNGSFAVPITPSRTPGRKPKGAFGGAAVGDERRIASAVSIKELSAALNGPGTVPKPGPTQALVRTRAVALNYRDILIVTHSPAYPLKAKPGLVPGSDGAGVVEEAGPDSRRKQGDRVILQPNTLKTGTDVRVFDLSKTLSGGDEDGTFRRYVVMNDERIVHTPKDLTFEEACTMYTAGVTAWHALFHGHIKLEPEMTVLTQGTGGLSCFAIQICVKSTRLGGSSELVGILSKDPEKPVNILTDLAVQCREDQ
ncbi:hypothetical protein DOTSEDRAFT_56948 [Dothistroma septosporum NZE10]|uniref:Cell division control protein n=1 Tax=Dothistroma septosporum (strain NZE10 / CBS 128990) TaxID=675120 RepID=M2XJJ1_DOTSN|nr:hypothetical protein DOTSEDRAFT_56948 [Dothistroma septosporum NZE10]